MAKQSPISVGAILIIMLGIIAILVILRNKHLFSFGPPAPVSVPRGPIAAAISTEPTCPAGEECAEDDQGRYDCLNVTDESYEATWCGSFSGDDLTIKLYGPEHHNEGDCCWCVLHIKPDSGQFVSGGEGPHPSSNCEEGGDGDSIGTTSNICVKATMEPGPTMTGYALVDGAWKQMSTYTGPCGCDEQSSEKTGDEVTFRCDGSFETTCATVKPLTGGTTPPPTTTPPATEEEPAAEEEEPMEEEEPAEEEEEEEPEEEEESGEAGAARSRRRRRRSNLARRGPVTRAMLSAYKPFYYKPSRFKIGNI